MEYSQIKLLVDPASEEQRNRFSERKILRHGVFSNKKGVKTKSCNNRFSGKGYFYPARAEEPRGLSVDSLGIK